MKQADQLQPWTLSFRASAKRFNFHFHFKFSKISPISKLLRFSIRFKIRLFTIEFESKPEPTSPLKRKLELFGKFFNGFRCKRSGNRGIAKSWLTREISPFWFGRRRSGVWSRVLILAAVVMIMFMLLRSYFRTRFLWNFFWMIWSYAAPSGFLHQFFKVIFEGFSGYH